VLFAEGYGALDDHRIGVGTLVVLREGAAPRLRLEADTTVLFFGGPPLGRRVMQGNVIASSEGLLDRALRELPSAGLLPRRSSIDAGHRVAARSDDRCQRMRSARVRAPEPPAARTDGSRSRR
jgi:hypothetical protein